MPSIPDQATEYVLGSSPDEQQRLFLQAAILRSITERYLRAAGLSAGMRVLDVGCGVGDVALLAAEIVGPSGTVLGIDLSDASIQQALARVSQDGERGDRAVVEFAVAEISTFAPRERFDAVVGRYVLHHQHDPITALRHIASWVRPGGLLAFHELDASDLRHSWPDPPLWRKAIDLLDELYRRRGVYPDFGRRLTRSFLDAGLPRPTVEANILIGGEAGSYFFPWIAGTVRSVLPKLEEFGLATAEELQIDTLAERMEAEAVACGAQLMGPLQFGAWVRMP